MLKDTVENVDFDVATGEHLDAIEASNNDWILHIGTEDGEVLNFRAGENDWFPNRLQNKVDFYQDCLMLISLPGIILEYHFLPYRNPPLSSLLF